MLGNKTLAEACEDVSEYVRGFGIDPAKHETAVNLLAHLTEQDEVSALFQLMSVRASCDALMNEQNVQMKMGMAHAFNELSILLRR